MIEVGTRVKVEFISSSRTEYDGNTFSGLGYIDLIEDGYVFGRLDCGKPFMCNICDVQEILNG